jgi:hypothetical protein
MENLSKEKIKKEFEKNGLTINKIAKTRLGDGFFIYHNRAMGLLYHSYKRKFIRENADGGKIYERTKETKTLRRDFVDSEDLLRMVIAEAKRR